MNCLNVNDVCIKDDPVNSFSWKDELKVKKKWNELKHSPAVKEWAIDTVKDILFREMYLCLLIANALGLFSLLWILYIGI